MNPSTAQARVLVDEWVRGGVSDVVVCPGSRNAPLLLAVHAADAAGRLRLHVRIDERSAGFLAVGLALRSERVVPVVVTSGTAAANLHPAVLEASYAGVALLVVTADRPPGLVGTGANQTVDQTALFGPAVRASMVLPLAERRPEAAASWRASVVRALAAAAGTTSADPGPVQLDVPLREPLVPGEEDDDDWPGGEGRPDGAPWTRVAPRRTGAAPLDLDRRAPTLVVAGHGAAPPAGGLPPGTPVVAEPASPLWGSGLRAGPSLLGEALSGTAPELLPQQVVVLGRPTLHRAVSRLLADPRVAVHAVPAAVAGRARPGWTDVAGAVRSVGELPPPGEWAPDPGWAAAWRAADDAVADAVDARVAAESWATGPGLAAAVAAALPAGALLLAGSSNPVRDLALTARPRADVTVLAARGVSGIDGAVSLATGIALARGAEPGPGPSYALLGDLTFLHDSGGLLAGPAEPRADLTVVVANDDGGSIFALLEQGAPAHADAFERVFGTPHGTDLAALCRAHGVAHTRPADPRQLAAALAPRPADGSSATRVVEVTVDRRDRRALAATLAGTARDALTGSSGSRCSDRVSR